jgi:hypothetical protein
MPRRPKVFVSEASTGPMLCLLMDANDTAHMI